MAPPQGRPIHIRFTYPDETVSHTDSNLDSLERCQARRFSKTIVIPQSIPSQSQSQSQSQNQSQNQNPEFQNTWQRRQHSSMYKGVHLKKNGRWEGRFKDPVRGDRVHVGCFSSEEEAHQACQAARDRIKKEVTTAVVPLPVKKRKRSKKGEEKAEKELTTVVVSPPVKKRERSKKGEEQAEKELTTVVVSPPVKKMKRTKKEEEKEEKEVTIAVVSPPVKKRKRTVSRPPVHPQSFVSKENQRNDIPSDNPTSGAYIRTGSTSSVHNTSYRPPGFVEDLSSQLLKQQEALTDAELKTGDFDYENDLIQVDHMSTWAGNLNWDEKLLSKK